MQDEEMDDIIRDAANQHYPAYDDQAWNKMEGLLDKHMPQKKDKRRYILFFLFFLLLGGGLFFAFFTTHKTDTLKAVNNSQNTTQTNTTSNTISSSPQTQHNNNGLANTTTNTIALTNTATAQIAASADNNTMPATDNTINNAITATIKPTHKKISIKAKAKFKSRVTGAIASDDNLVTADKQIDTADEIVSADVQVTKSKFVQTTDNVVKDSNTIIASLPDTTIKKPEIKTVQSVAAVSKDSITKKNTHSFKNNFAFTLSAGPGLSYVGLDYLGKTTFTYGAGIAYTVSKRFIVRTGFYVSSKIYSAEPADYHPPKSFWTYYPNLQKIDANCKVYEIPISVTYNFAPSKKHNWFAATGLASYLMKNEAYGYSYKNQSGQIQYANADINNQNKNIFSILTLSGGYQYHINKQLSVMAEPYLELPLNGIGFGKINLNSTGLLFTIVIKPFAAKK